MMSRTSLQQYYYQQQIQAITYFMFNPFQIGRSGARSSYVQTPNLYGSYLRTSSMSQITKPSFLISQKIPYSYDSNDGNRPIEESPFLKSNSNFNRNKSDSFARENPFILFKPYRPILLKSENPPSNLGLTNWERQKYLEKSRIQEEKLDQSHTRPILKGKASDAKSPLETERAKKITEGIMTYTNKSAADQRNTAITRNIYETGRNLNEQKQKRQRQRSMERQKQRERSRQRQRQRQIRERDERNANQHKAIFQLGRNTYEQQENQRQQNQIRNQNEELTKGLFSYAQKLQADEIQSNNNNLVKAIFQMQRQKQIQQIEEKQQRKQKQLKETEQRTKQLIDSIYSLGKEKKEIQAKSSDPKQVEGILYLMTERENDLNAAAEKQSKKTQQLKQQLNQIKKDASQLYNSAIYEKRHQLPDQIAPLNNRKLSQNVNTGRSNQTSGQKNKISNASLIDGLAGLIKNQPKQSYKTSPAPLKAGNNYQDTLRVNTKFTDSKVIQYKAEQPQPNSKGSFGYIGHDFQEPQILNQTSNFPKFAQEHYPQTFFLKGLRFERVPLTL